MARCPHCPALVWIDELRQVGETEPGAEVTGMSGRENGEGENADQEIGVPMGGIQCRSAYRRSGVKRK